MATLGLKKMGKLVWEGREKVLPCWLSQFSFAKLKPLLCGLDAMPLFLLDDLLRGKKCQSPYSVLNQNS